MAWSKLGQLPRIGVVVLCLAVAVLVATLILKWAPEWLAQSDLAGPDRAEDVGRTRTAVLATIAGLIAVAGAIFTGLSYRLNRAGQITERFTRAIDQLGASELDVRLGGIYALERIARDSSDDHPQVVEVLTAYVRQHAPWPSDSSETQGHGGLAPRPSTDVQAAVTVLGRRDVSRDRSPEPLPGHPRIALDLARTDLRGITLRGSGQLQHALLSDASLQGAFLEGADLEGALLNWTDLREAYLIGVNLEEAQLAMANLVGADLTDANLRYAALPGASFDAQTLWPDGFDAQAAGAKMVEDDRGDTRTSD